VAQERLDRIEDELETVKELLISAANYAESANRRIDQLSVRQDRTQQQLDQLSARQDRTQQQLDQLSTRQDQLAAVVQQFIAAQGVQSQRLELLENQFLEFQRTILAAVDQMGRVTDYLLRRDRDRDN
jgi:chromosome segregation ATPase